MSTLAPVSTVFRAAACALLPAAERLDEPGWREVERIVEHALEQRPPRMRRQFRTFLCLIDIAPLPTRGRWFRSLPVEERRARLAALERSPKLLMRRGVWGLRTLVFMGYYARDEAAAEIRYRAHVRGWQARA